MVIEEQSLFLGAFFIFGAMLGSFLNVVIYRWPREESFISPRSKCTYCKSPIPFYLNVPVLAWFFLMGRAKCCAGPISFRYPLVEFLTGLSFALTYYKFGLSLETAEYCLFLFMAIPCFFIDLDHCLLPDIFTKPGILLGFLGSFFVQTRSPIDSFFGIVVGGGLFWFIGWFYKRYRGKEGMGFGDVKLIAWLGGLGGLSAVPFIIWVAGFAGALVGVFLMVFKGATKNAAIPFGPFLISAGLLYFYMIDDLREMFPQLVGLLL